MCMQCFLVDLFKFFVDVIDEEALNEKYRVRVLRILIKKADTEILELEQDLLSLQTELAWVENEDWPDVCCNALREKIDFLDISIKYLRNKDKNDIEVRLLMYTQPVETLDKILKALFRNYICKRDKQVWLLKISQQLFCQFSRELANHDIGECFTTSN